MAAHPIANGDHASDHRLTVLAIAGPIARAENAIGDLPHARSRIVNVSRPKAQQTARELRMGSTVRSTAQGADRGQAVVEPGIAGEIEMKDSRLAAERGTDEVHPDKVTAIDQKMLEPWRAEAAHDGRKRPVSFLNLIARRDSARREHARVHSRRPHRPDDGAAVRRILSESAAPSATRMRHPSARPR